MTKTDRFTLRFLKLTLAISQSDKEELEHTAQRMGCMWGGKPSISALIRAIAQGNLKVSFPDKEIEKAITLIKEQLEILEQR